MLPLTKQRWSMLLDSSPKLAETDPPKIVFLRSDGVVKRGRLDGAALEKLC